ncbi:DUF547 domain-containing protein [Vicingaceae bacterium]|nr:DUF547 domain-containing protein [Vicingaceae bacterium]
MTNNKFVMLSIEMADAVCNKNNTDELKARYEKLNVDTLAKYLSTENQKKAFWINTYNSYIQILLTENPEYFEDRGNFFSEPRIIVAHRKLSFDDIEHGIIRGSKIKLSLGLLKNPFADDFEKKLRTRNEDGRIHFALNCGAKSCPLVATYDAKNFDAKIDKVAKSFLHKVSSYDKENNTVLTTPLFSWFRGDFEGKNGILNILKQYEVIPEDSEPKINYDTYDWKLSLDNYYRE